MYQLHWVLVLLWTFENLIHSVSKSQVFFKETPWPFCTSVLLQRTDPKLENWARYRSGKAVREITNPRDPTEYWTTYKTEHTLPVTDGSPQLAGGRPTQWHQHNILTGSVNNQCVSVRGLVPGILVRFWFTEMLSLWLIRVRTIFLVTWIIQTWDCDEVHVWKGLHCDLYRTTNKTDVMLPNKQPCSVTLYWCI